MNSRIEMVVCDARLTFQKSVCGIEISERRPRDGPFLDHLQGNSTNQGAHRCIMSKGSASLSVDESASATTLANLRAYG
jgi:hypothetical protein